MTAPTAGWLSALVLGFPLLGSMLNALWGPRLGRRFVNLAGTLSIAAALVVAVAALAAVLSAPAGESAATAHLWQWLDLGPGNLSAGVDVTLDPLSALMLLVITGVGLLIHVYSAGYMAEEPDAARFFSYMNFFIFSMLVLVLAANLVLLIIGWALVALSSYLLIGFWYERPSAVAAARKAFVTQVIGDVALVIAAFLLVTNVAGLGGRHLFSLSLPVIFAAADSFPAGGGLITLICILLAVGAFAKSAQFPLHTWLPDAMEGPTPVSALIHAATMVTAGVYLIARFHPLFDRAPIVQGMVACVGMGTALMAGVIALSQIDIKRVIAYSTMSQIGLMIYAVGIGAYTAGMYHFVTHAVFKALLFLAAGNVIHALHNEQDIRLMGGLAAKLRATERWFLAGSLSLAGFPLFAGWFSKENLLGFGVRNGPGSVPWILYLVGLSINVLTGLYAFRLWATVFKGEPQTARGYAAHEAPPLMLGPVAVLGALSVVLGFFLLWPVPGGFHPFTTFLDPVFHTAGSGAVAKDPDSGTTWLALALGTVASLCGIGAGLRLWLYRRPAPQVWAARLPRFVPLLSYHKFYFDQIYDRLLVRPVAGLGRALRRVVEPQVMDGWTRGIVAVCDEFSLSFRSLQTGLIRDYASWMIGGATVFLLTALWLAR